MKAATAVKLLFVFAFLTGIAACDRRSCTNVACQSYEQCVDGLCLCADGYEGTGCATESRLKYIGDYNVTESCNSGPCNFCSYPSYIAPGNYLNEIRINNLLGQGVQCIAYVVTDASNMGNTLQVPYQNLGSITVEGTGYYNVANNYLTLDLNYSWINGSYGCRQTFYRF